MMGRWKLILMVMICAGGLAACGGDDDPEENGGETGFSGGSFVITVQSVQDGCFDGAMNTIILPTGEPNALPEPVSIPASTALPAQVDIQFNEPFQDVTGIEFELVGDNGLKTAGEGFTQTGVDISASEEEECEADMMVTAELTSQGEDRFTGIGMLTITEIRGEDCPAFQNGPPCTVSTPLTATRAD